MEGFMFILKSEIEFDSAHYLSGYEGKCGNIHGHRYRLIVKVKGNKLKETGTDRAMVEDFNFIKSAIKEVHDLFDHKIIIEDDEIGKDLINRLKGSPQQFQYELVPYRPTAEEMSRAIFNIIKERGISIYEVELFETPTNSCIYREED
jgi:6-pyruvoyltetrahydropterin/6-carboxytetrahydropterin synthase